ncbi:hypothetical protein [Roseovarius aestuariivivens]|uniref:hypothetical protein n=1 Tax=Roseovarius aestuariivivens TaxID=1888910 RepID=UPI0010801AFF|nr:hypothetical protein [Roseovarius aestuariivivens]
MADHYASLVLSKQMLDDAFALANALPEYDYSHRKLQANFVGCLGELAFGEYLKRKKIDFVDDRHKTTHDFLISGRITLDVKTKDRTVRPRRHFDNSVPLYNHEHQRPKYYYFISLLRDKSAEEDDIFRFTHAFILGGIDIVTLEARGKKWNAGETDPENGTTFWTACINVPMTDLVSNKEMMALFRSEARSGTDP